MALQYSSVMLGTMTIKQPKRENGELVKDDKGRQVYNKFKIDIRKCNALAAFIYVYKKDGEWYHQLYSFFSDTQHMKNMMKDANLAGGFGKHHLFGDEVVKIKLNTYYKECMKMLPLLTKDGYEVECYYKEEKK
jgi:hypothetical protein